MNEASGYDEMQLERFGIYSNDTRNHHILWTPLTNKPLSKESSEAFNSSGEGPDDFKKMVSYLKSWKEKKERNELTQDDEKRKAENAIGALERLTVGATDEEIAKGPFFGDKGYNPLPPMENFVPNGNLLARSYVLELEREIRESPLPKWHPKGRQPSNEEEQRSKNRRRRRRRRRRRARIVRFFTAMARSNVARGYSRCLFRSVEITGREEGCESGYAFTRPTLGIR